MSDFVDLFPREPHRHHTARLFRTIHKLSSDLLCRAPHNNQLVNNHVVVEPTGELVTQKYVRKICYTKSRYDLSCNSREKGPQ